MNQVSVHHGIDDLASDLATIARRAPKDMRDVVKANAHEGNRIAKAFASQNHTMFGDEDIEYPPSFTVEQTGSMRFEYGPDAAIGDGSQASGYEHGSINSPPHNDLGRSFDEIRVTFGLDIEDLLRSMFWPVR